MFLVIIGALPPPRGGVTTHVERLLPFLEKENISYEIWDHSGIEKVREKHLLINREIFKFAKSAIKRRGSTVHCIISTVSMVKLFFFLLLLFLRYRIIFTFVTSPDLTVNGYFNYFVFRVMSKIPSQTICSNQNFADFAIRAGFEKNKINIFPAFIPVDKLSVDRMPIIPEIKKFCAKYKDVVLTYAHGPDILNGVDIYGLDILIKAIKKITEVNCDIGLLILIPEILNNEYYQKLNKEIYDNGLAENIFFGVGSHFKLLPLLKHVSIFIRNTSLDGDSLSLREALDFGVPAIATDVSVRPKGTVLVKYGDINLLRDKIGENLSEKSKKSRTEFFSMENNAYKFIKVFRAVSKVKS